MPRPWPLRSGLPAPVHQPDRGLFPAGTSGIVAPSLRRSALTAGRSFPRSTVEASQQLADVTSSVRAMTTIYSLAHQGGQFWGIFLQLQAPRLAKQPPQSVADNL